MPIKIAAPGSSAENNNAFLFLKIFVLKFSGVVSCVSFRVMKTDSAGAPINTAGKLMTAYTFAPSAGMSIPMIQGIYNIPNMMKRNMSIRFVVMSFVLIFIILLLV